MSNGHDAIVSRFGLITAAISAPTAVGQISKVSDVEEQEESGDEDEPLKFRELKDRLTLLTMLRRTLQDGLLLTLGEQECLCVTTTLMSKRGGAPESPLYKQATGIKISARGLEFLIPSFFRDQ